EGCEGDPPNPKVGRPEQAGDHHRNRRNAPIGENIGKRERRDALRAAFSGHGREGPWGTGWRQQRPQGPNADSSGLVVKEGIDLSRSGGIDSRTALEVDERGAGDRLQRTEMMEQSALAVRTDAADLLKAAFAEALRALLAMRADGESVRLVTQPL